MFYPGTVKALSFLLNRFIPPTGHVEVNVLYSTHPEIGYPVNLTSSNIVFQTIFPFGFNEQLIVRQRQNNTDVGMNGESSIRGVAKW